jgi:CheY-like chemotaxis protein
VACRLRDSQSRALATRRFRAVVHSQESDMTMQAPRVALVTDEPTFAHHVAQQLRTQGCAVTECRTTRQALDVLRATPPQALVIEGRMASGILAAEVVDAVRRDERCAWLPIVVCSADRAFVDAYGQHVARQGCELVGKPFAPVALATRVRLLTTLPFAQLGLAAHVTA